MHILANALQGGQEHTLQARGWLQAVPKDVAEQLASRVPAVFSVGKGTPKGSCLVAKNVRHHEHYLEQVSCTIMPVCSNALCIRHLLLQVRQVHT